MYTNSTLVQEILQPGGDYDTLINPPLTLFITSASSLVSRMVAKAATLGFTYTDDELLVIETWLAAHFYKSSDQAFSSKSTAGASGGYQGQTAMYLDGTKYGQQAKILDPFGILQMLQEKRKAKLVWLGKPESSQIPVDQRD